MSALTNAKHERFAQAIAKGKTATEAYVLAGYKANDGNAATLKGNQRISERIAEILENAAVRAEISVASVTENLTRIAQKAEKLSDASGLAVSRAAWMDAAKLNGLIIERTKADVTSTVSVISDQPLTPDEWAKEHAPHAIQ